MPSTTQRFAGKRAKTNDEVVAKLSGTLYPGEVTSINTGNDTPRITLTPDEDELGELSGLAFVDVPASLRETQADNSWFWKDAVPPPTLVREFHDDLDADASAINTTTWTTVLSRQVATDGDTFLEIEADMQAGVTLGGNMRLLINGGSFSNEELATASFPALGGNSPGSLEAYVELSASAQIYTVALQAQAITLGSVTPRAGSAMDIAEKRWPE